jgi:thiol-disulfide isomerase/thioredoxin
MKFLPRLIIAIILLSIGAGLGYLFYTERQFNDTGHFETSLESKPVRAEINRFSPAKTLPDFSFADANNQTLTLDNFKGKSIILNLWAEWCKPCVAELPELDLLEDIIGKDNITIIPVSIGNSTASEVQDFYDSLSIKNLAVYIDQNTYQSLAAIGIPTTILINKEGKEVARINGYVNWQSNQMLEFLNQGL